MSEMLDLGPVGTFLRIFALREARLELRIAPRVVLDPRTFPKGWNFSLHGPVKVELVSIVRDMEVPENVGLLHHVGDGNVVVVPLNQGRGPVKESLQMLGYF